MTWKEVNEPYQDEKDHDSNEVIGLVVDQVPIDPIIPLW